MWRRVGCGWLALLLGAIGLASAQGLAPIPKLEARVTDLTGTLTAEQQSSLEEKLAAFEARKGSQIAVLIVPTTHPEEIEQYSIRVVEQWRIGRAKVDDGVLLIVAKNDRRVRIEVGYGLEGALPDAIANRIIAETIRPLFAQNNYFGGISAGVDQIIRVIDGEALPAPDRAWHGSGARGGSLLPFLFIAIFIGSSVLRSLLGRPAGAVVTAGITGVLVWLFSGIIVAALAAAAAFFFTLLSGMGGGLGRPGGFGGWGGGMIGGGIGGGGGFSGGGGGFGGGGASGSW
jgi:uncharacterized protein